jgi:hypothetical protein
MRVEVTVVKILSTFLSSKENAVIYICQNLDDRHYARKKFDAWFKQNATNSLEKFDLTINYEETAYLTSLIVHENNTHKEELIGLFFDQPNQRGK